MTVPVKNHWKPLVPLVHHLPDMSLGQARQADLQVSKPRFLASPSLPLTGTTLSISFSSPPSCHWSPVCVSPPLDLTFSPIVLTLFDPHSSYLDTSQSSCSRQPLSLAQWVIYKEAKGQGQRVMPRHGSQSRWTVGVKGHRACGPGRAVMMLFGAVGQRNYFRHVDFLGGSSSHCGLGWS